MSDKYMPETPSANEVQHGGNHYKTGGIEPIDYIIANEMDFCEGNVVKYITRHKKKNRAEDIKKIVHYCQ